MVACPSGSVEKKQTMHARTNSRVYFFQFASGVENTRKKLMARCSLVESGGGGEAVTMGRRGRRGGTMLSRILQPMIC